MPSLSDGCGEARGSMTDSEVGRAASGQDEELRRFVDSLPVDLKEIARLHLGLDCEPMPPIGIAETLDVWPRTVAARMRAIRRMHATVTRLRGITDGVPDVPQRRRVTRRGELVIHGLVITRHGPDEYRIDGRGRYDADGAGAAIHAACPSDAIDVTIGYLARKDLWIMNGFKSVCRGNQWPNRAGTGPRLRLLPHGPVEPTGEREADHDQ